MKKFLFLLFMTVCYPLMADTPVLILHSYHESYPWTQQQDIGFKSVLADGDALFPLYSTEHIDAKRRSFDKDYEKELLHYFRSKYKNYQPKLIYVTDDDALKFMIKKGRYLFPSAPIVFSGIDDLSILDNTDETAITGVFEKKDTLSNLSLIKRLFPDQDKIFILGDGSTTSDTIHVYLQKNLSKDSTEDVQMLNEQHFDIVLDRLKNYQGKIVLLSTIGGFRDSDNKLIPLKKIIYEIINAGDFIVISSEDSSVQQGVIGGYANTGKSQGEMAGKMAKDILLNPDRKLPKPQQSHSDLIFDVQALKKYEIKLPTEIASQSSYINIPQTFFQKHNELMVVMLYLFIAIIFLGTQYFARYMYKSRKLLQKREENLAAITASMNKAQSIAHLGNWDLDIMNNSLWWSDEIYRIFGLRPQEFKATYEAFLEYVHPDDRELVKNAVERSILEKEDYRVIHRVIKKDGSERRVLEEGSLKFDDKGVPTHMTGIVHDITEKYEREKSLLLQAEIFNAVQDSIMVHDLDGQFIYLNENAWKSRGYTKEEMLQMRVKDIDAPEYLNGDPDAIKKAYDKMCKEGFLNFTVEHLCKNGDRIPVEIYAKPIDLEGEEYILSSVRDISQQIQIKQALEKSEKEYKDLVENAMIGIYRTELSGKIIFVNSALAKIFGYDSADAFIGENALQMYNSPDDRDTFIQRLQDEGHISNYELMAHDKNTKPVPVMLSATLNNGIITGMLIDMREIEASRKEINRLSKVVEQIDDSVLITDRQGQISYVNQAFSRYTGYTKKDALGKTPRILKSGKYDDEFYKTMWSTIIRGETYIGTLINKKKNGDLYYEKKTITPLKDDHGELVGFVSSGKDVTLETMMHQEMESIASTDKLTGIHNRHKFEELFSLEAERSRRFSSPLSLMLLDIDYFKVVNDNFGHDVGDEVLKCLVNVIKANIRQIDIFARWGGEEFLILSPGTDFSEIKIFAEKLRLAVENTAFPTVKSVTVSIGLSTFETNDTFSDLFKRADKALYFAKEHGRNQISDRSLQ